MKRITIFEKKNNAFFIPSDGAAPSLSQEDKVRAGHEGPGG